MSDSARQLARAAMITAAYAKNVVANPELAMRPWAYGFAGRPRAFLRQIIGEEWDGPDWVAWRAFVSAVFGEPFESAEEEQIFRQSTHLDALPTERVTRVWVPVGRRGGKSRVLAGIATYLACCFDWTPYLAPGELGVIPVIAQDRKGAQTIMGYVKGFLEHQELRKRVVGDVAVESVHLEGSVLIEVVTASYRAVRSRTVLAALCDEIAFWRIEDTSANPDTEIVAALEPAMATIPNALLLAASSPYARRGVLWNNFDRHFGQPGRNLVWKAPTWVMHPSIREDGEFIRDKYEEDPISASAEYGAEFRTDVQAFVTREVVAGAVVRDRRELLPDRSLTYKGYVDPSGGSSDSFSLAIGHRDPNTGCGVLDVIREREPPYSPEAVVKEYAEILKVYRVGRIKGDRYAGEWPRERFRTHGVEYEVCPKPASQIYLEFLPLLNAGRVELLDHPRMKSQLLGLERRSLRSGREMIDHPPRSHDDVANVTAGVLVELLGKRDMLTIDPDFLAKTARIVGGGRGGQPSGPVWR